MQNKCTINWNNVEIEKDSVYRAIKLPMKIANYGFLKILLLKNPRLMEIRQAQTIGYQFLVKGGGGGMKIFELTIFVGTTQK